MKSWIILHWFLTTSYVQNGSAGVFPPSLPPSCCSFGFFLAPVDDPALTVQFNIYVSFCLFGGRLAFMCLVCHADSSLSAFKALQAVWTKPSVWVGHFIKWQTGFLYLNNVSHGNGRSMRVCVCVHACTCVCVTERKCKKKRLPDFHGKMLGRATQENTLVRRELIAKLKGLCFYESALIIE